MSLDSKPFMPLLNKAIADTETLHKQTGLPWGDCCDVMARVRYELPRALRLLETIQPAEPTRVELAGWHRDGGGLYFQAGPEAERVALTDIAWGVATGPEQTICAGCGADVTGKPCSWVQRRLSESNHEPIRDPRCSRCRPDPSDRSPPSEDDEITVDEIAPYADPKCKRCFGKGTYVAHRGKEPIRGACGCAIKRYLKANPIEPDEPAEEPK